MSAPDPALTDPVWLDIGTVTATVLDIPNEETSPRERAAWFRCRDQVVAELARHALVRIAQLDGAA